MPMKKLSCLLILLGSFLPQLLTAQSWSLIKNGLDYYYQAPPDSLHLLRVDSFSVSGSDTTWFVNQITEQDPWVNNASFWHDNFTLRGWRETVPGRFLLFSSVADSFFIDTRQPINTPWAPIPGDSLQAWISVRDTSTLFGVQDSVIEIALSNGSFIQLSQDHGMVEFPNMLELIADSLSPPQYALALPPDAPLKASDFFDYQPGDQLVYYTRVLDNYSSSSHWDYWTILSRTDYPGGDSVTYEIRVQYYNRPDQGAPYYTDRVDTTTFKSYQYSFVTGASWDFFDAVSGPWQVTQLVTGVARDSAGRMVKRVEDVNVLGTSGGNLNTPIDAVSTTWYRTGLGETNKWGYGWADVFRDLVCWKIGSDTVGNCVPFDSLVNRESLQQEVAGLKVFPNPATTELHIEFNSLPGQEVPYALVDMLGRKQKIGLLTTLETLLDVQGLPAGMYLLQVGAENPTVRKVLIRK